MKKLFSSITLCILLLTCFVSCNNGSGSETYLLKMRLKPGDTFKQNTDMNMDMGVMGLMMNMKMSIGADFEVLAGDSNNKSLKITYTHMRIEMDKNMPGGSMADSISKKSNERIKGKSVVVKLGPGNKITEVSGLNEIYTDSLAGPAGDAVKKMFDKDNLNNIFGMMLSMYPEKPVKIGDSWNAATTMDLAGIKTGVDMKYTLQNVKDGMASIGFEGKLNNKGKMEQGGMKLDMAMDGTHTGVMQINLEDGYMRKTDFKMDIKGDMEMMGRKMSLTMKADGTMKGQ